MMLNHTYSIKPPEGRNHIGGSVLDSHNYNSTSMSPRIVLYSHDTLGFGHLRRNLLLANALKQCDCQPEILLIAGMREAGAFEVPPGVDCLTLPAYAKGADGAYYPRDLGNDLGQLANLRANIIEAAVSNFNPHLMIVDNVPRGAQAELDSTLRMIKKRGHTHLVLGLRDVIDTPAIVRKQWLRHRNFEVIRDSFDEVWIYGDPELYDAIDEYALGDDFRNKSVFVGFLDQTPRLHTNTSSHCRDKALGEDTRPYILCTVGGGKDGGALCRAFAAADMPSGHRGILITGSQMSSDEKEQVRQIASANPDVTLINFMKEPIALMAGAAQVVCMGGYNTVCEVLSLGCPALVVPRVAPRLEQWLRADRLAARGIIDIVHPDQVSADFLSEWLSEPANRQRPPNHNLDMNGLDRVRTLVDCALLNRFIPNAAVS